MYVDKKRKKKEERSGESKKIIFCLYFLFFSLSLPFFLFVCELFASVDDKNRRVNLLLKRLIFTALSVCVLFSTVDKV